MTFACREPRTGASIAMALAMALASLASCVRHAPESTPATRPNLVFIRCDDLARWAVHALGNPEIHTPNMDRIIREGADFTNAFVTTPVCSPSRAAALSGLHSVQTGVRDWIREGDVTTGIRNEYVLWPEVFHAAGYRTGLFGKWHIGSGPEHHPLRNGFDFFTGMIERAANRDPELEIGGRIEKHEGAWRDEFLAARAAEFIEGAHDRPFLIMVDLRSPHTPYLPVPEKDQAHYADRRLTIPPHRDTEPEFVERQLREYYSAVTYVDRCIGRVLDALDRSGLAENTIVVFTSDHGYMIGHHALQHKGNAVRIDRVAREAKLRDPEVRRPNMFDDSLRVPLAIRWPDRIKPGTKVSAWVIQQDFLPSLTAMAGLRLPKLPATQNHQGLDFEPLLRGKQIRPRNVIFGDYDMMQGRRASMRMIRTPEWKLVKHYAEENAEHELYDLKNDPGETRNLYATPGDAPLKELEHTLREWQRTIGDPLPSAAMN